MEQYRIGHDDSLASADFKRRMVGMMREMNERSVARPPQRTTNAG
jgi:hypothetical protein